MGGMLRSWSEVTGKESVYVQLSNSQAYDSLFPPWGLVEGPAFEFWEEVWDRSWIDVDGVEVMTSDDLHIDSSVFVGVKQTIQGMDWSGLWCYIFHVCVNPRTADTT